MFVNVVIEWCVFNKVWLFNIVNGSLHGPVDVDKPQGFIVPEKLDPRHRTKHYWTRIPKPQEEFLWESNSIRPWFRNKFPVSLVDAMKCGLWSCHVMGTSEKWASVFMALCFEEMSTVPNIEDWDHSMTNLCSEGPKDLIAMPCKSLALMALDASAVCVCVCRKYKQFKSNNFYLLTFIWSLKQCLIIQPETLYSLVFPKIHKFPSFTSKVLGVQTWTTTPKIRYNVLCDIFPPLWVDWSRKEE